jgi:replicative DNA helicase
MILAQLNRQAEQTGARPKLSHLRESGAIEQDADIVAILHRERDTDSERSREDILANGVPTELIIAKHRNGEVGIVELVFLGQFTRFENASKYGDEEIV